MGETGRPQNLDWLATNGHTCGMAASHPLPPPTPPNPAPLPPRDHPTTGAAWVSPRHLPALHHVAADLDELDHPVRIVPTAELDTCGDCADGDLPELGSVATVVATSPDGHTYRDDACALHLSGAVRYHSGRNRQVTVEVPAASRRWFQRDDRETYYAIDEVVGVGVVRGMWDSWIVVHAVDGVGAQHAVEVFPRRVDAEWCAQNLAAQIAADAYEAGFAEPVALPIVAAMVAGVAA